MGYISKFSKRVNSFSNEFLINYNLFIFIIICLIFLRFILAFYTIPSSDAAWHFSISRYIGQNFDIPLYEGLGREVFSGPPFFHIIAGMFYYLFSFVGIGELGIKIVSPICGIISIYLTYLISDILFGKKIAQLSTLFVAILPMNIYISALVQPDSMLLCLTLFAVYFMLKKRYVLSGVFSGFLLITKTNGLFILPLLLYLLYQNNKTDIKICIKQVFCFFLIIFLISLPVYLINYSNFNNPFWPYGSFIFKNSVKISDGNIESNVNIYNLLNFDQAITLPFLMFYGAPFASSLNFFNMLNWPLNLFIPLWVISLILFSLPVIFGLFYTFKFDSKNRNILLIWIIPFIFLLYFYLYLVGNTLTRYVISIIPVLGIFFAFGFILIYSYVLSKYRNLSKLLFIILFLFILSFAIVESYKVKVANSHWKKYSEDFSWTINNIPLNSKIYSNEQFLPVFINRQVYVNTKGIDLNSYLWINEDLDKSLSKERISFLKNNLSYSIFYENNSTKTLILKKVN